MGSKSDPKTLNSSPVKFAASTTPAFDAKPEISPTKNPRSVTETPPVERILDAKRAEEEPTSETVTPDIVAKATSVLNEPKSEKIFESEFSAKAFT